MTRKHVLPQWLTPYVFLTAISRLCSSNKLVDTSNTQLHEMKSICGLLRGHTVLHIHSSNLSLFLTLHEQTNVRDYLTSIWLKLLPKRDFHQICNESICGTIMPATYIAIPTRMSTPNSAISNSSVVNIKVNTNIYINVLTIVR